ncbi:MAG: tRNA (adenosine(37)-N6)-dimethylallyltransferase MiaA [Flavobacteriales bacterium]|nr:tRNA (adenosine(37)-N6)-dimethylallyltransferase MiaA [Flavobacteriales bacterium]NQX97302.1 tRNA (adenosine(37)-N6)-dimethylallyltransferase MiaA [Flavobacteriales bacterium]
MQKSNLIVILGCTATGKTNVAANMASQVNGEVISADSRQVYRGMDVGTGKDLSEFNIDGKVIPHHLIDIVDAGEEYNVFEYQKDFLNAFEGIQQRNNKAILCGGTGMYLEAVLKGYRLLNIPENVELRKRLENKTNEELLAELTTLKKLHNTTDSIERHRLVRSMEITVFEIDNKNLINDYPKIEATIFGIKFEREIIRERITKRLKQRLKHEGMIAEVEGLIAAGVDPEKLKFYGLEYKLITQFLLNEIDRPAMFNQLNIAIHQFSKRQATWFRKMERNGFKINWIDGNLPLEEKVDKIIRHCE